MKECMLYEALDDKKVKCHACAHRCTVFEDKTGICRVRKNIKGKLYSLVYGYPVVCAVDPVEKKPLYHFMPGIDVYSIGTVGCNFRCAFCQNYDIVSSPDIIGKARSPRDVVDEALASGCKGIAYTYNEPGIFIEMVHDTALLAKERSLKNVMVTNGYMTVEALDSLSGLVDAMNVDLKSFNDSFYNKLCGARLQPVLDCIRKAHSMGIHLEITTLVIPDENDSEEELGKIARFIASLDTGIPWHVSRFFPMHRMRDHDVTSIDTIRMACDIGKKEGLVNVHAGNI
ncbi:MAG: AmmeMemoRadiSam system radical SAM enzyme [Candidatus Woesearchaeota archaeon]